MNPKKAVFVAAGMSSRLYPLTFDKPKGLLTVKNESLLKRSIRFVESCGVSKILIVVGYKADLIKKELGSSYDYVFSEEYEHTNNMVSLGCAEEWIGNDAFLYLHSDLFYSQSLLTDFLKQGQSKDSILVEFGPTGAEAMKVQAKDSVLIRSDKQINQQESVGEWIGIAHFLKPKPLFSTIDFLLKDQKNRKAYDTLAMTQMAKVGHVISLISTNGTPWIEIDTDQDYERAKAL